MNKKGEETASLSPVDSNGDEFRLLDKAFCFRLSTGELKTFHVVI